MAKRGRKPKLKDPNATPRMAAGGKRSLADLPRTDTGHVECRRVGCRRAVLRPRKSFCSDECIHAHRILTDRYYVRQCVWDRDHGVCRRCRRNTVHLFIAVGWVRSHIGAIAGDDLLIALGFYAWPRGLWEADHIQAVEEGGGQCGLAGYQTLCVPCHKQKTKQLRRRLAALGKG